MFDRKHGRVDQNEGLYCHAGASAPSAPGAPDSRDARSVATRPMLLLMRERIQKNEPVSIFLALLSVVLAMAIVGLCREALMP